MRLGRMRPPSTMRKSFFFCATALFQGAGTQLHAQATLLLEEPYSYDGTFAGTGHAAVYLARVCAESPIVLRRCGPGETGVVISRYNGVAGRDWIAIPLIPYLYAVKNPEDIPLFADSKLVAFLRHEYLTRQRRCLLSTCGVRLRPHDLWLPHCHASRTG